jgi:hypothetical protein
MDTSQIYNDPILGQKRKGTPDDPFKDYNEPQYIVNGKVQLSEIPNRAAKVVVTGNGQTWYEVVNGVLADNTFMVDYLNGVVTFNTDNNNLQLYFKYKGEGVSYIPASRIYTKANDGDVTQTLQSLTDSCNTSLTAVQTATTNATNAANYATETTSDYETMLQNTSKIYKEMVPTYSDIATTYPNPQIGWTVTCTDTKFEYRWDGFSWVNTGSIDEGGFNIIVSSAPPNNVNQIWLDEPTITPSASYISRVLSSTDAPEDTNLIWLKLD